MFKTWIFRTARVCAPLPPLSLSTGKKTKISPGDAKEEPNVSVTSESPLKKLRTQLLQHPGIIPSIGLQGLSRSGSDTSCLSAKTISSGDPSPTSSQLLNVEDGILVDSPHESLTLSGRTLSRSGSELESPCLSGKTISSGNPSPSNSQLLNSEEGFLNRSNSFSDVVTQCVRDTKDGEKDLINNEKDRGVKIPNLNNLEAVVTQASPDSLRQLKPETLSQLGEKWGLALKDKIHAEASLETVNFSLNKSSNPVEALQSKSEGVRPVITALLALTGKKYTNDPNSPLDNKLATHVLTCLEALEKASNNNCIPSFSHGRALQQAVSHGPKTFHTQNIGGCRKTFEDGIPLLPIPMLLYGILASDNTQRKLNQTQHFGRQGMDRKIKHNVHTHNVRFVLPDDENSTNEVFNLNEVTPKETIMNCLLRPMDGSEDIVLERFENDLKNGKEATSLFLEEILDEVLLQRKLGEGYTAMEREVNDQQSGAATPKYYCTRCNSNQEYVASQNTICQKCGFNATHYPLEENPYRETKLPKGPHVEALWLEQEPLEENPGSRKNLEVIMEQLKNYWPDSYKSFPFAGDALPTMLCSQEQSDSVVCKNHNITVALTDHKSLKDHINCEVSIPYENVHFITGESHEELKMNRTALAINWHMGLQKFLLGLGRLTKQSQMSATKSGKLVDLFPITKCFTIGTLQALCVIYVREVEKLNGVPSVDGWIKFAKHSKDLMYLARMKTMVEVNIPVMIKRYAIRNNNAELADAATALFAPILFVTPSTYYREYVKHKYCNGLPVRCQEGRTVIPKTIREFLKTHHGDDELPDNANNGGSANVVEGTSMETWDLLDDDIMGSGSQSENTSETIVPTEHKLLTTWKKNHRFISFSSLPGEAEGVDFKQEAIIQKLNSNMARGKIFDMKVLQKAARLTYLRHCDGQEQTTHRKNPHCRYSHEIRSAGTLLLRQAEDPSFENGLGHLDSDVLSLRKTGRKNMKTWICGRLKAIPGGKIKLQKVTLTKEDREEQEKIESLTKDELREKIQELPLLDEEIRMVNKTTNTKDCLRNLFLEIQARLIAEDAANRFNSEQGETDTDTS